MERMYIRFYGDNWEEYWNIRDNWYREDICDLAEQFAIHYGTEYGSWQIISKEMYEEVVGVSKNEEETFYTSYKGIE